MRVFLFPKVQPDMEELTENAEDIAEDGDKKEEIKLGKLQYKVSLKIYSIRQPWEVIE